MGRPPMASGRRSAGDRGRMKLSANCAPESGANVKVGLCWSCADALPLRKVLGFATGKASKPPVTLRCSW